MFTPLPEKDTAVRFTAKLKADAKWDEEFNHYMSSGLENRDDVYTWIEIYDRMYNEEIENINNMVVKNWIGKGEEETGVEIPIALHRVVANFATTHSGAAN